MTELREFSEQVLYGSKLSDKLILTGTFTDKNPGEACVTPEFPGRPGKLMPMSKQLRQAKGDFEFPSLRELEKEHERAVVMHFFANHELMALELMALVLLKFPDAPKNFRLGVAQTMREEQAHVQLYLDRMAALNMAFGELPINDYFWRRIAPMKSPIDYVARLCLTFEQANLDFSLHFYKIFSTLGDRDAADVMQRVYKDEIGHVQYGLSWFQYWHDPGLNDWDAFVDALASGEPAMQPARAKGIGFNREGRLAAGLSPSFVDQLAVCSQSLSRPPTVYWFNPDCDQYVAQGLSYSPNTKMQALTNDLASLPQWLATEQDVVLLPRKPSLAFLTSIANHGLPLPEFVSLSGDDKVEDVFAQRKLSALAPWAQSPDGHRCLSPLTENLTREFKYSRAIWSPALKKMYAKSTGVAMLREFFKHMPAELSAGDWLCDESVIGEVAGDEAAVVALWSQWSADYDYVAVKAEFGAAGQQLMRIDKNGLADPQRKTLARWFKIAGQVVVEPWLDNVGNLSSQFSVNEKGMPIYIGSTHFETSDRGQYMSAHVGALSQSLPAELLRFLYWRSGGKNRFQQLNQFLSNILKSSFIESSFTGPIGVDMLIYLQGTDNDGQPVYKLKPIVEINPRFTMGRVALALGRHLAKGSKGTWRFLTIKEIKKQGAKSFSDYAAMKREQCPLKMSNDDKPRIKSGVLFTTDPDQAAVVLTELEIRTY